MFRCRSYPTPAQDEAMLLGHCAHTPYVWNLAVEQHAHWRPGRKSAPGYLEQCRQLTAARADNDWLRVCGQVDADSRESQARFVCTACGYADNADVNAARNIAAGGRGAA